MESLALPLRIGADGRLERTDPVSSLMAVIRAMAASPAATWQHAPWFGLQEVFEGANLALEQQPVLADALNRALTGLGITWAQVESVTAARDRAPGERRFDITLVMVGGRPVHRSLSA
ncbi:MAG TPA: hypothetical protein VHG28_22915 [Longimicrobiaceae bacterium]|nr:hypothetical protein [Longimicrobiaceae bacterium]